MARTTLATTNARIDSLKADQSRLEEKLDRLLAYHEASAPAKPVVRRTAKPQPKADAKVKTFRRKDLDAFRRAAAKDGYDFDGWSALAVAGFCVETGYSPKGWVIGEGYTNRVLTGSWS